jgi:hypothetical protein
MNALVEKRMELIPTDEGSDWRDLPNIVTKLSDGSYSQKLVYSYNDVIQVLKTSNRTNVYLTNVGIRYFSILRMYL